MAQQPFTLVNPATRAQIQALMDEKASRTPAQRKMDSQLVHLARENRGQILPPALANHQADVQAGPDNRVLVDVQATVTQALRDFITGSGGTITSDVPAFDALRVRMPVAALEALAGRGDVRFVEPAVEATTDVGSKLSEAPRTHRADTARTLLGVDGSGIKIGVLSDGVDSLAASKVNGNLNSKASVIAGQAGSGHEGTAMMELIQDIVPGAELIFATAVSSSASFANNILSLQAAGCTVIVDDVGYADESPFQDMVIAQAVQTVSDAGVMYFVSARNAGNKNDGTSGTWEGDFSDGGALTIGGKSGRVHNFGGANFNTVTTGGSQYRVDFFWADPRGGSSNDYDVFVTDAAGTVLRSSTNVQTGTQNPYEAISTLNVDERIVILQNPGAANRFLHLDTGRGRLSINTDGRTRGHHACAAANAFGVAATDVGNSPSGPFTGGVTNPVENFSSDGPRRFFFLANGTALTPGNFSSTGGQVLIKPDITAADGATTSAPGFESFFGTSASAPNAAAIAAMIRNYKPSLTPAQVRTLMTSTALDIEAAGVDRDSGAGIVMALPALQATSAPDVLTIAQTGLEASGPAGGPFTPASGTYTLTNTSGSPVNWTASSTQSWNSLTPASGTLAGGGSVTVRCSINTTTAAAFAAGSYNDTVTITNTSSGFARQLAVSLLITTPPVGSQILTVLPFDGGNSVNARAPSTRFNFARSVYLVTAAELAGNGFTSGSSPTAIGWGYFTAPGVSGAAPLKIYLQNTTDTTNTKSTTWTTAISGMTTVHNTTTTLPSTIGTFDITFSGGSPFTYTGGGLYVAFDWGQYTGTLSTTAVASCNTALLGGLKGAQGAAAPTTIGVSDFRPETRLTTVFTSPPAITTPTSASITSNSAILGGNVTNAWGSAITARGVVYAKTSENSNPVIGGPNVMVANDPSNTTGVFTVNVGSLTAGTSYSFAAYATTAVGTTYTSPASTFATTGTPTTVTSLNRVNPTPSNLATVNWTLTFAAAVSGVTASNFSLSGTAATGTSIGTPTTSNGGLTWNVPVSTGALDGTLTLSLANATGLSPGVSTSLPFAGQAYTMQKSAPTISGAVAGQAVTDKTTVSPFTGVTLADVDLPALTQAVSVTLDTAAKGSFTTLNGFTNAGGGSYTFSGTAANATTAIRGLVFTPAANRVTPSSTETTTFTISISDGIRPAATDNTATVVSTSVNDAPTIAGAAGGQAVTDKTTVSPFTAVTLADVDSPAQTQSVSVTLDTAAKGSFTTLNGFTNAGGGSYTFSGTAANATTAIRGLVFTPAANRVTPGTTETTTFTVSINDSVASVVTNNTTTVVSTSVNDAPTIAGSVAGQAVTDKTTVSPFSAVTLADVDFPAQTQSVSVTLDTAAKGSFTALNGFTNAGGGSYTFSGTAANATTAIRGLVFTPAPNRVTPATTETTTFTVSINDSVASAVTNNTTTVVSTSVNDAPTIAGTVAGQAVNDNATISPFPAVALADVDSPAQTQTVSVTLDTAAKGTFTTLNGFTNAGGGSYTFSGTAANATTAIRGLVFTPTANRVAAGSSETTTFTISTNDGVASAVTNNTTTVVSTAINDAPTLTAIVDPATILEDAAEQTINLSGITAGGGETQTLSVTATSGNPGVVPDPIVTYTSANATGSLRYTPVADVSGSAVITVTVQDNGGTANGGVNTVVRTFTVNVAAVNDTPTLTSIVDPSAIFEDGAQQTINLTGIGAGGGETQTLNVTAVSNNPSLIPDPAVNYTSAGATGSLTYTPVANASGSATITVTVQDNGGTANAAVDTVVRTFTVNVTAVNDAPTLTTIADPAAILEDAAQQTINLAGIGAGGGEMQTLTVTATSNNPSLIPNPTVTYTSANATGSLSYTPVADASGSAIITVTVQDNGGTDSGGVNTITRTFTANVTAVNDAPTLVAIADPAAILEDAAQQTINLTGIGAGGGEMQVLSITATSDKPSLIPHPTVNYSSASASGSLNYTPVADANGSAVITVTVQDDGGTSDGGVNTVVRTFTVNVTAVNDAPTLAALANPPAILEDAAQQTINLTGIGAGLGETQALTVTAVSSNPGLIPDPAVSYASANTTGSLSYTPVADQSGSAVITVTVQDDGGTASTGENTTVRTFTVNVTAVNDAPTLTAVSDPAAILEDAGAQTINLAGIGTGGGETQALTVTATSDNPTLIPSPSVTYASAEATGSLSYTPVANANGTAVITVTVQDDGGTANGGENQITRTFTVDVTAVNDTPSFTKGSNVTVLEDAGGQTISGWATAIDKGAANESAQTLDFLVTADQPSLFATPPAIAADGTLTFTWAANGNGSATVSVALHDDGGTSDGGDNTSDTQTFTISTTAVNDAPTFVAGPSIDTAQDAGAQTFIGWATNISPGPGEGDQTVEFLVQVDRPGLFATQPTIEPNGTLAYAPAPTGSGVAVLTIRLKDNGETTDGGSDTSAPQTVEIAVTSYVEELGSYTGLVQPTAGGLRENARTGTVQMKVTTGGKFTGKLKIPGKTVAMKGVIDHDGAARFGSKTFTPTLPVLRKNLPPLDLALKIEVARGTNTFAGTITQGANGFATLAGDRALYTAKRGPVAPLENVPSALLGYYTVIFPALTPAEQGIAASAFPQGDGFGKLTVTTAGIAKLSGTLADGSKISSSAPIAKSGRWPVYRALGKTGSLSGFATFRDVASVSDVDASDLLWFKAPNAPAKQYPNGWPGGILVDLAGAKYTAPTRTAPGPVLPGLSTADGDGNAELTLVDGGLADADVFALSIDTNNLPMVITSPGPTFTLTAKTGLLKGTFIHPASGKKVTFNGAVLQKQQIGSGFFLGPVESGAVILVPDAQPGVP